MGQAGWRLCEQRLLDVVVDNSVAAVAIIFTMFDTLNLRNSMTLDADF